MASPQNGRRLGRTEPRHDGALEGSETVPLHPLGAAAVAPVTVFFVRGVREHLAEAGVLLEEALLGLDHVVPLLLGMAQVAQHGTEGRDGRTAQISRLPVALGTATVPDSGLIVTAEHLSADDPAVVRGEADAARALRDRRDRARHVQGDVELLEERVLVRLVAEQPTPVEPEDVSEDGSRKLVVAGPHEEFVEGVDDADEEFGSLELGHELLLQLLELQIEQPVRRQVVTEASDGGQVADVECAAPHHLIRGEVLQSVIEHDRLLWTVRSGDSWFRGNSVTLAYF